VKDKKNSNEVSALKIFDKEKVTRLRKHKDILMEKYALEKMKESGYIIRLLETFKDENNLGMRFEAL
jgi:serine/threonine protein kinase